MEYKNPGKLKYDLVIKANPREANWFYVEFPKETAELFGTAGRVPVNATFGGIPYRGSLVTYAGHFHILPMTKVIKETLGKQPGDKVTVTIELDEKARVVELPKDVKESLEKNPKAREEFEKLSYSHKREYMLWIEDAKKAETRARRIEKMVSRFLKQ